MKQVKAPSGYFGGKGRQQRWIVPLLPAHHVYVEPFCGMAGVFFGKPPSPVEVLNDRDSDLVNFFRVLRDPELFPDLERRCALTPYSRQEWEICRATWDLFDDPVERAYRWYIVAQGSFSGQFANSWSSVVEFSRDGMAGTAYKWLHMIAGLPAVHARLMRAQLEYGDWRQILTRYDTPRTLFYCDPPYAPETRGRGTYRYEMTNADHADLVTALLRVQGKVVLSGYQTPLYAPLDAAGWRRLDIPTHSAAVGRTRASGTQGAGSAPTRLESLWFSPNAETPPLDFLLALEDQEEANDASL